MSLDDRHKVVYICWAENEVTGIEVVEEEDSVLMIPKGKKTEQNEEQKTYEPGCSDTIKEYSSTLYALCDCSLNSRL